MVRLLLGSLASAAGVNAVLVPRGAATRAVSISMAVAFTRAIRAPRD